MKRAITILVLLLCLLLNGSLLAQSETETENTSNGTEENVPTTEEFKSQVQVFFDEVLDVGIGWDALQIRHISNVGYGIDNVIGLNGELRDTLEVARQKLQSEILVRSLLRYDHFWTRALNRNEYSPNQKEIDRKFDQSFSSNLKFDITFFPAWDTIAMDVDAARKANAIAYNIRVSIEGEGDIWIKLDQNQIESIFNEVTADKTYEKVKSEAKPQVNEAMFTSIGYAYSYKDAKENNNYANLIELIRNNKYIDPGNPESSLSVSYKINQPIQPLTPITKSRIEVYAKDKNSDEQILIYKDPEPKDIVEAENILTWNGTINQEGVEKSVLTESTESVLVKAVVSENQEFTTNQTYSKSFEVLIAPEILDIKTISESFDPDVTNKPIKVSYTYLPNKEYEIGFAKYIILDNQGEEIYTDNLPIDFETASEEIQEYELNWPGPESEFDLSTISSCENCEISVRLLVSTVEDFSSPETFAVSKNSKIIDSPVKITEYEEFFAPITKYKKSGKNHEFKDPLELKYLIKEFEKSKIEIFDKTNAKIFSSSLSADKTEFLWDGKMNTGENNKGYVTFEHNPLNVILSGSMTNEFPDDNSGTFSVMTYVNPIVITWADREFSPGISGYSNVEFDVGCDFNQKLTNVTATIKNKDDAILYTTSITDLNKKIFSWNGKKSDNNWLVYSDGEIYLELTSNSEPIYKNISPFARVEIGAEEWREFDPPGSNWAYYHKYLQNRALLNTFYEDAGIEQSPLDYMEENLVEGTFMGYKLVVHKKFYEKLQNAESKMKADGKYTTLSAGFKSGVDSHSRFTNVKGTKVSDHALGFAIDMDREYNPQITSSSLFNFIEIVTGTNIYSETNIDKLLEAQKNFKSRIIDVKITKEKYFGWLESIQSYLDSDIAIPISNLKEPSNSVSETSVQHWYTYKTFIDLVKLGSFDRGYNFDTEITECNNLTKLFNDWIVELDELIDNTKLYNEIYFLDIHCEDSYEDLIGYLHNFKELCEGIMQNITSLKVEMEAGERNYDDFVFIEELTIPDLKTSSIAIAKIESYNSKVKSPGEFLKNMDEAFSAYSDTWHGKKLFEYGFLNLDKEFVEYLKNEGLRWGGNFYTKDFMHFDIPKAKQSQYY